MNTSWRPIICNFQQEVIFTYISQDFSYFPLIWKAREMKSIDMTQSRASDKLYILQSPVLPGHSGL